MLKDRFRQWLGADHATKHFLNQWWLFYRWIYASPTLNELRYRVPSTSVWYLILPFSCSISANSFEIFKTGKGLYHAVHPGWIVILKFTFYRLPWYHLHNNLCITTCDCSLWPFPKLGWISPWITLDTTGFICYLLHHSTLFGIFIFCKSGVCQQPTYLYKYIYILYRYTLLIISERHLAIWYLIGFLSRGLW